MFSPPVFPGGIGSNENSKFLSNQRSAYGPGYGDSSALLFPVSAKNDEFHPKEIVIGITIDGISKAYTFSELEKTGKKSIKDRLNGNMLEIKYHSESKSVEIFDTEGNLLPGINHFWFA